MKRLFKTLIFLALIKNAYSQNLVPNPSFEDYYDCSTEWLYISNAVGWTGMQTADYYNSCIIPTWIIHTDVPENTFGYQQAKKGNAYAGIYTFYPTNYREYIQINLAQSLFANVNYCVSYNLALADTSRYAVKKIGAYFSVDTIIYPFVITTTPPDYHTFTYYNPQIESNILMNDTANWKNIEGVFLAAGNEEYITIGNFRDDTSTDTVVVRGYDAVPMSYYYIDDVSVEIVLSANAGNDTSITTADSVQIGNNPTENAAYLWQPAIGLSDINSANPMARPNTTTTYIVTKTQCSVITTDTVIVTNLSVGINENAELYFRIYPNPASNEITLGGLLKLEDYDFIVLNVLGQDQKIRIYNNSNAIDVTTLNRGVYFVKAINTSTKKTIVRKFIKN